MNATEICHFDIKNAYASSALENPIEMIMIVLETLALSRVHVFRYELQFDIAHNKIIK